MKVVCIVNSPALLSILLYLFFFIYPEKLALVPDMMFESSSKWLGKIALELSKRLGYEYLADLEKHNDINWKQVELIQKNWNYEQEGLTPAMAALIAIAVTVATGGTGGPAASVAAAAGGGATGAAASAAFVSLASQATITLINNKGDISKTLNDLASSDTVRSLATAAITAGVAAQLGFNPSELDTFSDKLTKGITEGFTNAVADTAINGTSFEDALKNSLRSSLVDVLAAQTFSEFVKDIDADTFARNLAHKLTAAGVGCITAEAKQQSCDAGALGAAVGEVIGDYLVDDPNALTDAQRQQIINIGKLTAGSVALLAGVDVNTAAQSSGLAIENNSLKVVTTTIKAGGKVLKLLVKNRKVTYKNLKDEFKKEGISILDDVLTLADGELTIDDAKALVDLAIGTDINNRKAKAEMIVNKRGSNSNPYSFKDLTSIASKRGYKASKVGQTDVLYNKKGSPKYLVRSRTTHKGDVYKGYNSARDIRINNRSGSYDIHLNKVGK